MSDNKRKFSSAVEEYDEIVKTQRCNNGDLNANYPEKTEIRHVTKLNPELILQIEESRFELLVDMLKRIQMQLAEQANEIGKIKMGIEEIENKIKI